MVRTAASLVLLVALTGCRGGEGSGPPPDPAASVTRLDQGLRDELVQMQAQDQGERTSGETLNDTERTERLKEIIDEHGWPTYALVGKQGEDAAWVIAQHSEDHRLTAGAQAHEGVVASRLGLAGWPATAEETIVARDCALAREAGAALHVCHVSAASTVDVRPEGRVTREPTGTSTPSGAYAVALDTVSSPASVRTRRRASSSTTRTLVAGPYTGPCAACPM